MRFTAKKATGLLIAGMLAISAAGCGSSNNTTAQSKEEKKTDYPKKPITVIVPYGAGGGNDTVARMLASVSDQYLGQKLPQSNRTT